MAVLTAVGVYAYGLGRPGWSSDFDQTWYAAHALWQGQNPYDVIGPGKPFEWKWPFYYPLPAAVLVAPVGQLSALMARSVFMACSVGALAWAITRDTWERWPLFLSMTFLASVQLAQWSPLVTAALLLPSLSWIAVAKPNWGVAIVAASETPRIWVPLVAGVALLSLIAFVVQPTWVSAWLEQVRSATHFRAPIFMPGGVLMLAAALRWRRPEARLLLAIACLPQTAGFYDALMLFTIPRTFRQTLFLVACSYVVFFTMVARSPWPNDAAWMNDIARLTLWCLYLPCVVLVLLRPNDGTLPVLSRRWRRAASLGPSEHSA
jgi:hypothetical protein